MKNLIKLTLLFILFIGCQPYLNSQTLRKKFALILLAGTFPVLFMGIMQGFFGIYGPFKSPLDLIVWFQRPIKSITDLTSIFNNPNYYGSWLNIIWPFCLATTIGFSKKLFPQLFKLFFLVLTPLSIVLTSSRGARLGLIFSLKHLVEHSRKPIFGILDFRYRFLVLKQLLPDH